MGDTQHAVPFNYGLKQCGARVIEELTFGKTLRPSHRSETPAGSTIFSLPTHGGPDSAISGDAGSPKCWEFCGPRGQLGFSLVELLHITSVSINLEFSSPESAPRSLVLWGVIDGQEAVNRYHGALRDRLHSYLPTETVAPRPETHIYVPLAAFQYNPHLANNYQFSSVFRDTEYLGFPIGIVVLQILDNWGANSTRLCGVEIHGLPETGEGA
jgi:hypothetical protein